ncbi:MAG: archaeal/vacuolar-type H+-ATPase subunit, partial [Clostridia bacterium]|nr:archaeal/vacuolar-type H+-ATPase subunit [Clostridia bacterium]
MAIVKMKRVTVIAPDDLKDSLLKELMWLSSVDITPLAEKLDDPEWSTLLEIDGEYEKTSVYSQKVNELNQSMELLAKYSTVKKSLLTPRYLLTRKDFEAFEKDDKGIFNITSKVSDIKKEAIIIKNQQNKLITQKQSLLPWQKYPLPLESELSANTKVFLGLLPNTVDIDNAASEITEAVATSYTEKLSEDSEQQYIAVICHKNDTENISSVLSRLHFSTISFKGIQGIVSDNIEKLTAEIAMLDKQLEEQTETLKKLSEKLPDIERAYDILNNHMQLYNIRDHLLKTHSVFMLDGWLPVKKLPELNKLLDKFNCYYEINDPLPEDEPPILLKNNSLISPFEAITEMYALPTYRGLDPNFVLGPFYFILFGLMLSDAGYGLIITIACALFLKIIKPRGNMRTMLKMFMYCGISTTFWGIMFGSFFGDIIPVFSETFLSQRVDLKPIWFNPVEDPLTLLGFSFVLGYLHIMT